MLISICIPAYKRTDYLQRCLESIARQTFQDFEVVITDDSPDDSVQDLCRAFPELPIRYFRNQPALGTPANWNKGLSLAEGEWIKLMHDDDWFREDFSLQDFVRATDLNTPFIFSGYRNVSPRGEEETPEPPLEWLPVIQQQPMRLLARNVIGPPSVTLFHRSLNRPYETRMKWRVDIDYYITQIENGARIKFIDEALVNVGVSPSQVTNSCLDVPQVEIPELQLLLQKHPGAYHKDWQTFDAIWRILRNTKMRTMQDLEVLTGKSSWPFYINSMLAQQRWVPSSFLSLGFISKPLMFLSFLRNSRQ